MQFIKSSPYVQQLGREEFCKLANTFQLVFSLNCSQQLLDPQKDPWLVGMLLENKLVEEMG
jgi:hypothetical protein